jgi:hypothetical protein
MATRLAGQEKMSSAHPLCRHTAIQYIWIAGSSAACLEESLGSRGLGPRIRRRGEHEAAAAVPRVESGLFCSQITKSPAKSHAGCLKVMLPDKRPLTTRIRKSHKRQQGIRFVR